MSVTENMLLIKALDSSASLDLSTYTRQWYVSARIEISDGACLSSVTAHRDTPDLAVLAFINALMAVDSNQFDRCIVTNSFRDARRQYVWNGAAFAEVPHFFPTRAVSA